VDRARHKRALKSGGNRHRLDIADIDPAAEDPGVDLLALHDAIDKLEAIDKRKADLVKLRFFVGLTIEDAAQALGISTSTADNDWAYARCWLRLEIGTIKKGQTSLLSRIRIRRVGYRALVFRAGIQGGIAR
jgi:DNA-directed RNA polymerase specialized sigma24 family protein